MKNLNANDPVFLALIAHLAPCRVVRISAADEFDSDGDPVLRLKVVVDQDGPSAEPSKLFTATGIVKKILAEKNDNRFPLLTYPSSSELPEAAA